MNIVWSLYFFLQTCLCYLQKLKFSFLFDKYKVQSYTFDIKIFNNGTLEELYLQGEALVSVADPVTRDKERDN